jgi:hypothetical protein
MAIAALLASSCIAASRVHYDTTPWLRSGAVTAKLVYYAGPALMDSRVNQSPGAVMYANRSSRIIWPARSRVVATLLGSKRSFRVGATVRLPETGCWSLTVRSGKARGTFVIRAIDPPAERFCEASPVYRSVPHPKFGQVVWMPATPRTTGIAAVRFVSTLPDAESAVIYAGGRAPPPDSWSTKFLWWSPQRAATADLTGRRLDGRGSFRQSFQAAAATEEQVIVYPSIVTIPTAGCWAVTIRIGARAGLVVFNAVVT